MGNKNFSHKQLVLVYALLFLVVLFSSCSNFKYTTAKATKQFDKAIQKDINLLPKNCIEKFPCSVRFDTTTITKIDSIAYIEYIEKTADTVLVFKTLHDTITKQIAILKQVKKDSCKDYTNIIDQLQSENNYWLSKANNIPPPVIKIETKNNYFEDSAKIYLALKTNDNLQNKLNEQVLDNIKLENINASLETNLINVKRKLRAIILGISILILIPILIKIFK